MSDVVEVEVGGDKPSTRDLVYRIPVYFELGAWRDKAECKTLGPEVFFAEVERGRSRRRFVQQAIKVCESCSVRKECYNYAKKNNEVYGVWGGVDFYISRKNGRAPLPESV